MDGKSLEKQRFWRKNQLKRSSDEQDIAGQSSLVANGESRRRRPLPPYSGDDTYWVLKSFPRRNFCRKNGLIWRSRTPAKSGQRCTSGAAQLPFDAIRLNGRDEIWGESNRVRRGMGRAPLTDRWMDQQAVRIKRPEGQIRCDAAPARPAPSATPRATRGTVSAHAPLRRRHVSRGPPFPSLFLW